MRGDLRAEMIAFAEQEKRSLGKGRFAVELECREAHRFGLPRKMIVQDSKEFVVRTPLSDPAHQAAVGGLGVANEKQNEKHPREGNQAGNDHERIEEMCARGESRVGKLARQ